MSAADPTEGQPATPVQAVPPAVPAPEAPPVPPVLASPAPEPVFPVAPELPEVPDAVPVEPAPAGPTSAELAAAATPIEPDPDRDEAERLEPMPTGPVTLASGTQVEVVPLKLRETMKLLKIVTTGAGQFLQPLMNGINMDDGAQFAQTLGALVLMSIPDATEETVAFIQAMVIPAGMDAMEQQDKIESMRSLMVELYNPELDDMVSIVERVIRRESEDIRNLGKRIGQAFKLAQKVGEIPKQPAVAAS